MSIKIKVSYTDDQDLAEVIRLLSSVIKRWKKQPAKGKYKRAYGESNSERTPSERRKKVCTQNQNCTLCTPKRGD